MPASKISLMDRLTNGMPALLLVTAFLALAFGFWKGDLTTNEADRILAANQLLRPTTSEHVDTSATVPFARILASTHRLLGKSDITELSARSLSVMLLLMAAAALYAWLNQTLGSHAALAGLLAVCCSIPGIWASTSISETPLLLLSLLGFGWSTTAYFKSRYHRCAALLAAGGGLATFAWTLHVSRDADALIHRHDWLLGPFYALLLSLPWSFALVEVCRRNHWRNLPRLQAILSADAIILALTGIVLSVIRPDLWIGCSLLTVAGSAVAMAVVWERREPQSARTLWAIVPALGIPAAAVVAAGIRIGVQYQQMEKVQAIFITGLVAMAIGGVALRGRRMAFYWVPSVAVLVVCKIVYLHALLPERDVQYSSRPRARAVARFLESDAILYTPLAVDASFRFYLRREVRPLNSLTNSENGSSRGYALVHASDWSRLQKESLSPCELVRQFEWPGSGELYLVRQAQTGTHAARRTPITKG